MVELVGVGDGKTTLRKKLLPLFPVLNFFLAIAPPSEHFREKLSKVSRLADPHLGGVGEVSERFEHFDFNMGVNGDGVRGRGFWGKGRSDL